MKGKWVLAVMIVAAALFFVVSLVLFLRAGRSSGSPATGGPGDLPGARGEGRLVRTVLYYFQEDRDGLVGFPREVELPASATGSYHRLLEILLSGQPGAIVPVPEAVKVRSVFFLPGAKLAVIDFSETLNGNVFGGSQEELDFISFFVANLCRNFPEIQRVRFLSGGVDIRAPGGHLDWERSYSFDPTWVAPK